MAKSEGFGTLAENKLDKAYELITGKLLELNQRYSSNLSRGHGAKLVVIDPLFTPTARISDRNLQIRPSTDGLLALAIIQARPSIRFYPEKV
ncbi:hypothetical protein [Desulfosporosinus fructosivorans]|nr:hypothetical protein [Desulfosporosinus fructosivorans]